MASTGYRFFRYYTGDARYRRKGPPELALRLLAPMVVLSTVVVFASGVALLFAGPSSRATLLPIHKDSFFVWAAFMAVHVLGPPPVDVRRAAGRLRRLAPVSAATSPAAPGACSRSTGALVVGAVLAVLHIPEFGPWMNGPTLFHLAFTTRGDPMRIHTTHTRDAALRQLSHINRWLIAGSVLLTGVLTEAAANAFPGRRSSAAQPPAPRLRARPTRTAPVTPAGGTTSGSSTAPLQPPAQAPQGAGESAQAQEPAPEQESQATHETTPEPAPEQRSGPRAGSPAGGNEPTNPRRRRNREPEPEPVVSGGS